MKYLTIFALFATLLICGCSATGSGGGDAPAADYSGVYTIARESGDPDFWTFTGELTILQDGSNAALHYKDYSWEVEETTEGVEEKVDVTLVWVLRGTGLGRVKGRKIDVTWEGGSFTRLNFSQQGDSFTAVGDISFAGVKKS